MDLALFTIPSIMPSLLHLLTLRRPVKEALRYGEAVDKGGNSYDGLGNLVGESEAAAREARIRRAAHQRAFRKISRTALAVAVTSAGIWLLLLAKGEGQGISEIAVEVGTAFALSGGLWWVSRQLRGEAPGAKADVSALLILTGLGALTVSWALTRGATGGQAMLGAGSALATVWLFVGLERFFAAESDAPLLLVILFAPILLVFGPIIILINPFLTWALRGLKGMLGDSPGQLDVREHMDSLRIQYEMDSLDSGEAWHYPEIGRQRFEPKSSEVEYHLGVLFPEGFPSWIDASQGVTQKWVDESLISAWTWGAIREHPVKAENSLVFFADCDLDGHRSYIAIDLRESVSKGSVVQYCLEDGVPPQWNLIGDPRMLATSFANFSNFTTRSFMKFPGT
jgi:hypothetical protein